MNVIFDYPIYPYHAQLWKEFFALLYHGNNNDIYYKVRVGNMISVVVHDNHL